MEEVQTGQAEGVNQIGSPEHINQMLAAVDSPVETHDAGFVSNDSIVTQEGRPAWLPDKFDSPEAMARAYSELETRFHSNDEQLQQLESQANYEQQAQEVMETPPHMVDQLLDERGLDFSVFQQEYNETGQLSEDAYLALQEAGIEPQMVDTWIAGQEAIADQQIDSIYNMVGGEQAYNGMLEWAGNNLQSWEMDAFNEQIESLDANSMFAVQGLMARMQNDEGSPPMLYQGEPSQYSAPKYDSLAQLTSAMSDPRYASDPAFRMEVTNRLKNSELF
tara:strand:- start:333 stop:1163 length:831 start_codon:yes stop_codon:yes gene_type:complete